MCSRKLRCPRLEISIWQRIPTRQSRGRKEKTVAEKITEQETTSGQARSNEIAVVANTTSTEDLKKMEEDGFSISDADSHTIITVTDKIKAALAKAGVDVSSMGGTLTKEQLEEITGSPVVTQQIMDSLAANDLAGNGGKCAGQCGGTGTGCLDSGNHETGDELSSEK